MHTVTQNMKKSLYLLVVASVVFRPDDSNNTGIIAAISTLC